nr:uroporphyrinogen decarboxylase family protein [Candidatus Sigynarchaeota archaeon]
PYFLYGAPVVYRPNQDPWSETVIEPGDDPVARILALDETAIEERFHPLAVIKDRVHERYSQNEVTIGPPDLQGPMNLLFRLCGERIYGYMLKKKDIAHRLFDNITRTFINSHLYFRELLHGTRGKSMFSVAECCSYLESPGLIDEFNRKYDNQCAAELGPMNLHSCGESTRNLDVFSKFDIVSAEFGFGTDLAKARRLLVTPGIGPVPLSCRLEPKRLLSLSKEQVTADVEFIIHRVRGGPASICSVGVDLGTPRKNLLAAMARVEQYNKEKEEEEQ